MAIITQGHVYGVAIPPGMSPDGPVLLVEQDTGMVAAYFPHILAVLAWWEDGDSRCTFRTGPDDPECPEAVTRRLVFTDGSGSTVWLVCDGHAERMIGDVREGRAPLTLTEDVPVETAPAHLVSEDGRPLTGSGGGGYL